MPFSDGTDWSLIFRQFEMAKMQQAQQQRAKFENISTAGLVLSIGGAATQAIGAYFSILGQRDQLKSQQLSFEFEQTMANFNARAADRTASEIIEAGRTEVNLMSMQYAQEKSARRTAAAGRGVVVNTGSAAEEQASVEYTRQVEAFQMNLNTVARANAARLQATELRNRGLLAGVSARNAGRTANTLQPAAGAFTSLVAGAGQVANQWIASRPRNRIGGDF